MNRTHCFYFLTQRCRHKCSTTPVSCLRVADIHWPYLLTDLFIDASRTTPTSLPSPSSQLQAQFRHKRFKYKSHINTSCTYKYGYTSGGSKI